MAKAKLIIRGEREIAIERAITSLGRTPDNAVSLADDPNVSRYHAEIEKRGDEFWLIELGSSNGTTVNGVRLYSEKLLKDGDVIVLGGSSQIVFKLEKDAPQEVQEESAEQFQAAPAAQIPESEMPEAAAPAVNVPQTDAAADLQKVSRTPMLLMIAGAVCGLAVVFVVVAVLVSMDWSNKCEAKAVITNPENGETISKEVEIEVEAENTDCVRRAIFLLDGEEVASVEDYPYTASLDPKKFPDFSDGLNHSLKIAFEDAEGNKIVQPGEVLLVFETLATPTPTPEVTETPEVKPTPGKQDTKQASLMDIQEMSRRLLGEFGAGYKLDQQFLQEVQKKTSEYAQDGYFARAAPYRDLINVEFHKANGLPPPLGHLLAMSRSKFNAQKQGAEEGLWRLTDSFVTANNYKAACLTESLSDTTQSCAAKASAIYTKALFSKIFDINKGELVYAVAAFGMTEGDAAQWRDSLPPDRADFWKAIKDARQREQVVRFFAAGIVSQNPQKFRLKDRPITELYRNFMTQ